MVRVLLRSSVVLLAFSAVWLLPTAAFAQAAITGVVRDTSGAVLPGVTVEAASPVLIEKVRVVVSDDTGQYRIVDLRPGTYSVSFALPGFSTVRREGIELTGAFVATVNADLRVGALEETITVTGETPIVDVQSARTQQVVSKDVLASIPTSRNAGGIQSLIPGMSTGTDSGGISGGTGGTAGRIYGGRGNDSRTYNDGISTGWAGGSGGGGNMVNVAGAQEIVLTTSGGLGEAETSGVVLNVVPREGSNAFSGSFAANGASGSMQGSNYTQALQDQGLRAPSELLKIFDVNPMGGGRIIRDRLWFYLTYREWGADNTVPGMWHNRNAGNPNVWTVDFDTSRQAFTDARNRNGIGRITWQATPRNKINLHWSEQYNTANKKSGGSATLTPEASSRQLYQPSHIQQATWSSPVSSRLLMEAGWGTYLSHFLNPGPRTDGSHNPRMIRAQEQAGQIPNLTYRMPAGPVGGGFSGPRHQIGTLANLRASVSYVTGAHNMKFGYQGGFSNPTQHWYVFNDVIHVRLRDGVPNRLTQTVYDERGAIYVRNLVPTSLYAQDQWTSERLTLQGGIRYDHLLTSYPDSRIEPTRLMPNGIFYPSRSTPGISWDDVSPRMGAAYDLFGNGKTAVKFSLGRYMEAFTATNSDVDLNPLIRATLSTTRSWTDTNKDFVPNCDLANPAKNGECGVMDNRSFGQEVFTRSYDPDFISGYGKRPVNWEMGASVQHEILPRISATVGYHRRWFGNHYTVDNLATAASDYTEFCVPAPVDARLPGGGGQRICGLYDVNLDKVGLVDEYATHVSNYGKVMENWHGFDVGVVARLRNGLTVQGGTSSGRRAGDTCAARAKLPETYSPADDNAFTARVGLLDPYCRVIEPIRTSVRGLATYTVPRVDLQVSGTWTSDPGTDLAANYVATNAVIAPSLGRNLSSGSNVTVNLIRPGTFYASRRNNVDFRVAKILRYGRTRTQVGLDVYNLANSDGVTGYNQTFSPTTATWLTPTSIVPARYAKISAQFDF